MSEPVRSNVKYDIMLMTNTCPGQIWVGNQVQSFEFLGLDVTDGSSTEEFEAHFPVGDITTDVFILVKEEYSISPTEHDFIGRIVIPLSAYVTPKGAKVPTVEWMSIYPIADPNVGVLCTTFVRVSVRVFVRVYVRLCLCLN